MKLIPTFKSDKAERNCKFCMFFWTMLIMFLSVGSIADEEVIGYTTAMNSDIPTRYLDPIKVKGKKDEIIIYTTLDPLLQNNLRG
jgi:hypothetical protein